jgi:hypothetical protein
MSYQHWPSQKPLAFVSVVGHVAPPSVDLINRPPDLSYTANTVVGLLTLYAKRAIPESLFDPVRSFTCVRLKSVLVPGTVDAFVVW